MPVASFSSSAPPQRNNVSASWVGAFSDIWREMMRKPAVLSLRCTLPPASPARFSRSDTFSHSGHSSRLSASTSAMSTSNVVSADTLLVSRQVPQMRAQLAVARDEVALGHGMDLSQRGQPVLGQAVAGLLADAPY